MTQLSEQELQRRRAGARRTAWILGSIAMVIFLAFVASGVIGR